MSAKSERKKAQLKYYVDWAEAIRMDVEWNRLHPRPVSVRERAAERVSSFRRTSPATRLALAFSALMGAFTPAMPELFDPPSPNPYPRNPKS